MAIYPMEYPELWKNPYDGKEYEIGQTIPLYQQADGGLVGGEKVVLLHDISIPAVGNVQMPNGTVLQLPAIEPDPDWFYIGPSGPGWRVYYARMEIKKDEAIKQAQNSEFV